MALQWQHVQGSAAQLIVCGNTVSWYLWVARQASTRAEKADHLLPKSNGSWVLMIALKWFPVDQVAGRFKSSSEQHKYQHLCMLLLDVLQVRLSISLHQCATHTTNWLELCFADELAQWQWTGQSAYNDNPQLFWGDAERPGQDMLTVRCLVQITYLLGCES